MKKHSLWLMLVIAIFISQNTLAAESGVLNAVTIAFQQNSEKWASIILSYATWLFWTLATISLVWTFGFLALRKADIGEFFSEFIRFILFAGFYLWLLQNGPDYAMSIIRSLMVVGAKAGGVDELNPSTPVSIAFDILGESFKSLSAWSPIDSLAIVLVCLIILVCLAVVAANVLLSLCSAWVMAYAGLFVLGFGGSRWTSDIAIGYFKAIAGIALKLMTMTLMIGIATSTMDNFLLQIKNGATIEQLLVICVVALVLAMLIHSLPNLVASLIPGGGGAASAVGSFSAGAVAGAAIGAATTVGAAVASGGASLAANVAGGASAVMSAFKSAQSDSGSSSDGSSLMQAMSGMSGGGGGDSGGSFSQAAGTGGGDTASAGGGSSGSAGAGAGGGSVKAASRGSGSGAVSSGDSGQGSSKGLAATVAGAGAILATQAASSMMDAAKERIAQTAGGKLAAAIDAAAQQRHSGGDLDDEVAQFANKGSTDSTT